jgi:hypothetical protein
MGRRPGPEVKKIHLTDFGGGGIRYRFMTRSKLRKELARKGNVAEVDDRFKRVPQFP